jgi:hypothetical protein
MLTIFFDSSCSSDLRQLFTKGDGCYFSQLTDPGKADAIIFGNDKYNYIINNKLYQQYKDKCICISETDLPTYVLPSLYSSNRRTAFVGMRRSETINYPVSQINCWNEWIHKPEHLVQEKKYLYSFLGGSTSFARKRLFRHFLQGGDRFESEDVIIEVTDWYKHWSDATESA